MTLTSETGCPAQINDQLKFNIAYSTKVDDLSSSLDYIPVKISHKQSKDKKSKESLLLCQSRNE